MVVECRQLGVHRRPLLGLNLWLGSKALRGERQRVADELATMHGFLLAPLGVAPAPASLSEAVVSYNQAREAMHTLGVVVQRELGQQVSEALQRHGLLALNLTP